MVKYRKTDGKTKTALYSFVFFMYIFIFQQPLQAIFAVFQYADEMFALLAAAALALDLMNRRKLGKGNIGMMVGMCVVLVCGFYSACVYQFQPWKSVFTDAFTLIKFFMSVYVGERLFSKTITSEAAKTTIRRHCIFIIYILI